MFSTMVCLCCVGSKCKRLFSCTNCLCLPCFHMLVSSSLFLSWNNGFSLICCTLLLSFSVNLLFVFWLQFYLLLGHQIFSDLTDDGWGLDVFRQIFKVNTEHAYLLPWCTGSELSWSWGFENWSSAYEGLCSS